MTYNKVNTFDLLTIASGDINGDSSLRELIHVVSKDDLSSTSANLAFHVTTEFFRIDRTEELGIGVDKGNLGIRVDIFDLSHGFYIRCRQYKA